MAAVFDVRRERGDNMSATILIVDDYEAMRKLLRRILRRYLPEVHIIESASGEAALEEIGRNTPDLAIVDVEMPGLDGIAVTRHITRTRPECQVLIFTGCQDDDRVREAGNAGAREVVQKTNCCRLIELAAACIEAKA